MRFEIATPTKAYLLDTYSAKELEDLQEELTYTNESAAHDVKRHYANTWLRNKNHEAWEEKLAELKSYVKNTLVFKNDEGLYIRPSSLNYLDPLKYNSDGPDYSFPIPKKIAWAHMLPFKLHPYQTESVEKLLQVRHGNVELCTGAGKSVILLCLCRETGFRTAVVAPSSSIFNELVEKFEYFLGKGNVGTFGDGKKKIGKKITVCIADSLVNVEKDTEEWRFFSGLDMMCIDESHTWGADTLENLCHGLFSEVPYRFFMSGTQTRTDGTEKLLQSIIGPTVCTLTTEQAIAGGYICTHDFTIIDVESSNPNYNSTDPLEEKRIHFLNNRNIATVIAKIANSNARLGKQTLVLAKELPQIAMLTKLLTVRYAYAHSSKNKKDLEKLGLEKVDKAEAVEKFNKHEIDVLIGTSCIATGTNIYPTHYTCNWMGGASEIETKQGAVGRSVRLHEHNPYADKCVKKDISHIIDFNVHDIRSMKRHLGARISCYRESGTEIKRINLNAQKIQTGGVR